jgi:hypothetical protein
VTRLLRRGEKKLVKARRADREIGKNRIDRRKRSR